MWREHHCAHPLPPPSIVTLGSLQNIRSMKKLARVDGPSGLPQRGTARCGENDCVAKYFRSQGQERTHSNGPEPVVRRHCIEDSAVQESAHATPTAVNPSTDDEEAEEGNLRRQVGRKKSLNKHYSKWPESPFSLEYEVRRTAILA